MHGDFYGTVVSHILSGLTTIWALAKVFTSTQVKDEKSSLILALSIPLVNSLLAVFRYGDSRNGYKLRQHHMFTLNLSSIISLTICEVVFHFMYESSAHIMHLPALNLIPFINNIINRDYRTRVKTSDIFILLNSLFFMFATVSQYNYNGLALIISYLFGYFVVGECGYFMDTEVPAIDIYQFIQCFLNYFVVATFCE